VDTVYTVNPNPKLVSFPGARTNRRRAPSWYPLFMHAQLSRFFRGTWKLLWY